MSTTQLLLDNLLIRIDKVTGGDYYWKAASQGKTALVDKDNHLATAIPYGSKTDAFLHGETFLMGYKQALKDHNIGTKEGK
jgi:hypothetical protein